MAISLCAQKEDFTWVLGYNFERDTFIDEIGGMDLFFHDAYPRFENIDRPTALSENSASICHPKTGELLFYTNGYYINNKNNERMVGGDSLLPVDANFEFGDFRGQASLILPFPDHDSMYVLIHRRREFILDSLPRGDYATELYYSIIDLREDDGLGAVTEFAIPLLSEWLINGQITACRHGNGRDWWIVARHWLGQEFYFFLLDPNGVHFHHKEGTKVPLPRQFGRAEFSPDGRYLAVRAGNGSLDSQLLNLTLYTYDRCSGFIDTVKTSFNDKAISSGDASFAFSPNSRFVYTCTGDSLLQYDIESDDIPMSKQIVAVFDSFFDPFFTYFFIPLYAPNNKVYILPPNSHYWWHTIHAPDSLGQACRAVQHDFRLPKYNVGAYHNFPRFRLGPLDGSACDTLDIDNVPGARFRYEGSKKHRWFVDLSYRNPTEWFWEFGDGETSSERLPIHDYDSSGVYEVCLTVSNQYGQDRWCDSLKIDCITSSQDDLNWTPDITVYPNPSPGIMKVEGVDLNKVSLSLTDVSGRRVSFERSGQFVKIMQKGVYLMQIGSDDFIMVKKVVVQKE
jgi:hypothetical protein